MQKIEIVNQSTGGADVLSLHHCLYKSLMGTDEYNLTEDAQNTEYTLQNTNKANTHARARARRLQSVKYLPTVQKCGSSICSAKVSVHLVAGLKLWNTVQANRVTSDVACVFIYKAGVVVVVLVRRGGGVHFLGLPGVMRSSQRGSINEWWAGGPHAAGPASDWLGARQE